MSRADYTDQGTKQNNTMSRVDYNEQDKLKPQDIEFNKQCTQTTMIRVDGRADFNP